VAQGHDAVTLEQRTTCYFVGTRDGKMASITEYYDALSLLPYPAQVWLCFFTQV